MRISLYKGFLASLDALTEKDRKRTREALSRDNLEWHTVMKGFVSIEVSGGIRIIAQQLPQQLLLLHVNRHDAAYRWAERHMLRSDPDSDLIELVTLSEIDAEERSTNLVVATSMRLSGPDIKHSGTTSRSGKGGIGVREFEKYEEETNNDYPQWVNSNPNGYVLNIARPLSNPVKLHTSRCVFIQSPVWMPYVSAGYFKVCSNDKRELIQWIVSHGKEPVACKTCKP